MADLRLTLRSLTRELRRTMKFAYADRVRSREEEGEEGMSAESICDGCGKRAPMEHYSGRWFKPSSWFERSDEDGCQTACSRECINKVAEKSGKTAAVLPI